MSTPCRGLFGAILGHKFAWGGIDQRRRETDHCLRCGMPKGGWKG
jgi:hypothetical protein